MLQTRLLNELQDEIAVIDSAITGKLSVIAARISSIGDLMKTVLT